MVWWLAAPLIVWAGKKVYDAVTEDDEPRRNYAAENRERESRERRELALSKARQTVRSYVQGQGLEWDSAIENAFSASELSSEAGRARLSALCQSRFAQSSDQMDFEREIQTVEVEETYPKSVLLHLRRLRSTSHQDI